MAMTSVSDVQSLPDTLILDGLKGKSTALHAYDRMIWIVRTGFLTLFFVGWGIFVRTLLEKGTVVTTFHVALVAALVIASLALATAGYRIDLNYCRRKSLVVNSYNRIIQAANDYARDAVLSSTLLNELQIAGDSGVSGYDTEGYKRERTVARYIYTIPLCALGLGIVVVTAVMIGA